MPELHGYSQLSCMLQPRRTRLSPWTAGSLASGPLLILSIHLAHRLPQWLSSKESVCNTGDTGESGSIPGPGRSPAEGNGNPFIVFLPGKSHGQRNLVGYSPRGSKELDMSERKHSHTQYGDPLGITWRPFLGLISLLSLPGSKTGLRSIPP